MTFSTFKTAVVLCLAVATTGACDKGEPSPEQTRQSLRDQHGESWRTLLGNLDGAADDAARVKLLEDFIERYPQHPDLAGAKLRLGGLRAASVALEQMKKQALEEGEPTALGAFIVVASVPSLVSKEKSEPLAEPLALHTPDGLVELDRTVLTYPSRVRGHIRRVLKAHAPTLIDERCDEECLNDALNAVTRPVTGGTLVEAPGRLNKDAVGTLLEKAFVTPDKDLFGTPASRLYAAFQPTVRAYAAVGKAAREADVDEAAATLNGMSSPKEIRDFYAKWAADAKIAEKTGLQPVVAGNITSWWIRRHADGSGPLFADYLRKVVDAYDAEYAPKLQ